MPMYSEEARLRFASSFDKRHVIITSLHVVVLAYFPILSKAFKNFRKVDKLESTV